MKCFKYSNIISEFSKISGTCKSGRTWTDYSNFLAFLFCCRLWLDIMFSCIISNKSFKLTNWNRFTLKTSYTFAFALAFLWTYTATDCRKCWWLTYYLICFFNISFFYLMNETRNINWYRTSFYTLCILAINASCCLFLCLFHVISQTYFFKIFISYVRSLLSDWNFL